MKERIEVLRQNTVIWKGILNTEGIWLFLATLGSWSVSDQPLRLAALLIVLFLFGFRSYSQSEDKKPIMESIKELEQQILKEGNPDDFKKARLHELSQLKLMFSWQHLIKYNLVYLICMIFWGFSLTQLLRNWQ